MPDTRTDLASLALDALGRVVLSDNLLAALGGFEGTISAGGTNVQCGCPGGTNTGCNNTECPGTSNVQCVNSVTCEFATNYVLCTSPRDVPGD